MGTLTVSPPIDGLHPTITINGRTYTCAAGSTIVVPECDGKVMAANDWSIMPYTQIIGLQSVTSPVATLTLDPTTGDVFQASSEGDANGQ